VHTYIAVDSRAANTVEDNVSESKDSHTSKTQGHSLQAMFEMQVCGGRRGVGGSSYRKHVCRGGSCTMPQTNHLSFHSSPSSSPPHRCLASPYSPCLLPFLPAFLSTFGVMPRTVLTPPLSPPPLSPPGEVLPAPTALRGACSFATPSTLLRPLSPPLPPLAPPPPLPPFSPLPPPPCCNARRVASRDRLRPR
jgi:hypothetical protein